MRIEDVSGIIALDRAFSQHMYARVVCSPRRLDDPAGGGMIGGLVEKLAAPKTARILLGMAANWRRMRTRWAAVAMALALSGAANAQAQPLPDDDSGEAPSAVPANPTVDHAALEARLAAATTPAKRLGVAYAAYDAGDFAIAHAALAALDDKALRNRDYALWIRGQVELHAGDPAKAVAAFTALQGMDSRLTRGVAWRLADAAWAQGRRDEAAKAYRKLLETDNAAEHADLGAIRMRLAELGTGKAQKAALRDFLLRHPTHPLVGDAMTALGDRPNFTHADRLARARALTGSNLWHEAVAELGLIPDNAPRAVRRQRDYQLGTTLFKMRRRYADASALLLAVYPHLGKDGPDAMFKGARALSRADRDDEAITWYQKVVTTFPKSTEAQEAQYLSGWLEFNRGNYAAALAPLAETIAKYPQSKWAVEALWFSGMSNYLLGKFDEAQANFTALGKRDKSLEGGKGQYWLARTQERRGEVAPAHATYIKIIQRWPFSWYALLAGARLRAAGAPVDAFGGKPSGAQGPAIATTVDPKLNDDPLIKRVDELLEAGLGVEAGDEMRRGEKAFIGRHDRAKAYATLLHRYQSAGDFNRPWMLGEVHGGQALRSTATGGARVWWENAYPQAYRALVERYQGLGKNPPYYLYSIMRKESGFDPHVLSYADAQGLLQMIPATTIRVAKAMKLPYAPGQLYEPEFNIQVGSWYIGHLLQKFDGQIPLGAGSFNSGPKPVMRWLDRNGTREIDEFVELVAYTQTREYMKKVTENYARYRYLYDGVQYEQPLAVDPSYQTDDLTY